LTPTPVSEDVRAFLREQIETYEELEVLLFLQRETLGPWSVDSLRAQLRLDPSVLCDVLTALRGRKLINSSFDGFEEGYQLSAEAANNETLAHLAALFENQSIEVIKLMSANSIDRIRTAAVRSFADAFVFRKGKNNG
jgi:ornithine cyclodeaminase/alanine dehydrogenase-like protein (mu-crystallin family)